MGTVWFPVKNFYGVRSVSISERLKEERELTGMNQTNFGAIGGVTKKSQMLYESGERTPDASYLRGVAGIGVDVQYVLTGLRSKNLDELLLTDNYVAETRAEFQVEPFAPQVPVVRKAHKFMSQMLRLLASGGIQEGDIDVLIGMVDRLAKHAPVENVSAKPAAEAAPQMPKTAVVLSTEYKGKRTGPKIVSTEHIGPRTGPQVLGQDNKAPPKKKHKDDAS